MALRHALLTVLAAQLLAAPGLALAQEISPAQLMPPGQPAIGHVADEMILAAQAPARLPDGTLLLQGTIALPQNVLWAGVTRYVLDPGAILALGGADGSDETVSLYLVESGALTIAPEGPTRLTRAGSASATAVAPGKETMLTPGDRGFTPAGVGLRWRNNGDVPAVVLGAGMTTGGCPPTTPDVVKYTIVDEMPFQAPADHVLLTVGRVTLQPDEILIVEAIPGLEMLRAEAGQLVVVDQQGTPLREPPVIWATRTLRSFPPGRAFASSGGQPATLLIVTVGDANPLR